MYAQYVGNDYAAKRQRVELIIMMSYKTRPDNFRHLLIGL